MRRILSSLIAILCLAWVGASALDAKDKPGFKKRKMPFTIDRSTTYIDGPIDRDGFPDYERALNERLREGVTPENNATVLLFKAFGPHPEGSKIPAPFFKWLKIEPPPEKGNYLINTWQFVQARIKGKEPGDLRDLHEKMYERIEICRKGPWSAKEHPDIADWLKVNDKPLAVAIEASKRPRYYYPLVTNGPEGKQQSLIGALIPGVQKCREFGHALTVRAMLRVQEKKYDEAWQDLLACHRLGRLVGSGGGTLIEGLVGVAVDNLAGHGDLAFLEHAKLDRKQLDKCLADLQKLPPTPKMAEKVATAERFMFLQTIMLIERDGVGMLEGIAGQGASGKSPLSALPKVGNWDPALRQGNQFFNRMSASMRLSDRSLRAKHLNDIEVDIKTLKATISGPGGMAKAILAQNLPDAQGKVIGDILICLLVPAVTRVQQAADRAEQTQNNLHIAFALAAYQRDNGNYPKTLDALAPKYLPNVPIDIFSGKALIYRPAQAGYQFYSVGVNGRDDKGQGYDDDPPGDDLGVRMPRTK